MRRLSATPYCCLFWTLIFLAALPISAQVTGRVVGAVVDQQKRALPNAHVSLFRPNGSEPLVETQTTSAGNFVLDSITPGVYRLVIDLPSFSNFEVANLTVSPGADTPLNNVVLEVGATKSSVETVATSDAPQMSNAELTTTLSHDQLQELPQLLHDPLSLIQTQVGVSYSLGTYATIDGLRPAYNNVTLDGINVQDNYYRAQSLDYLPNRLFLDQISEFTLVTSNQRAIYGGGATQVAFATPSGTNAYHGELYYLASPNVLNANEWEANTLKFPNAYKRNQGGATFAGPILKDRLFFFTNYELLRYTDGRFQEQYSPTPYLRSLVTNPAMQSLLNAIPAPNSGTDPYLDFYEYLAPDRRSRDNATGKLDFYLSSRQSITATYAWNREKFNELDETYCCLPTPSILTDDNRDFASLAWRFNITPTFTNEVRGGLNLAPLDFVRQGAQPSSLVEVAAPYGTGSLLLGVPVYGENQLYLDTSFPNNLFDNDAGWSRNSRFYTVQDNASWTKGRQTLQFGFQWQLYNVNRSSGLETIPIYETVASLAGIATGTISTAIQSGAITSHGSGFVPGAPADRRYQYNGLAFYGEHTYRISRRLTTTLGLRYENYSPVREENNLLLRPDPIGGNYLAGLLSPLGTMNFANGGVYHRDNLNFAPSFGLAFDPFGTGKTAIRGGYSIAYVSDDIVQAMEDTLSANVGGRYIAACTSCQGQPLSQTPVPFTYPNLQPPFSFSSLGQGPVYTVDPNLRTPYVQEWSVGVQQEWKSFLFQAAYVGNHATGMLRAVNLNQANLTKSGFLSDFNAVQAALQSYVQTGKLVLPSNPLAAYLINFNNPKNLNAEYSNIVNGLAGQVAYDLGTAAGYQIYQNPYAQNGAGVLSNYSQSSYNGLQLDARRRLRNGLQVQVNYAFSKVLSDVATVLGSPVEPYRDANNPRLDYSRAPFDLTHTIKANFIYELPFGAGKRFSDIPLRPVLGGWSVSGLFTRQSGTPFSILSGAATLDPVAAPYNTANALVGGSVLSSLFGVRQAAGGTYFIWDGSSNATKDFSNPAPGQTGYLQPRQFSGPWVTDLDFGIQKRIAITERQSAEVRFEATNIFNHPSYYVGNQTIGTSQFGQILSTFYPARKAQITLYYRF